MMMMMMMIMRIMSQTVSLTPHQRAAYNNAMEHPLIERMPKVIFSSLDDVDQSTLARDEVDPAGEFLKC